METISYSKVLTHKSQPADEKEGQLKRSATFLKKVDLENVEFEQVPTEKQKTNATELIFFWFYLKILN